MPADVNLSDPTVSVAAARKTTSAGDLPHSAAPASGLPTAAADDGAARVAGYEILDQLGEGGMGTVWRARQLGTQQLVALKLLKNEQFDAAGRARFVREVELSARLRHPHIARVYDSGVHQNAYFYVMELVDGVRLDSFVAKAKLKRRQVLELMRDICAAVGYAHQKLVVHRDLKPSNILVTADGQPHVLDFGLAKAMLEADLAEDDPATARQSGYPRGSSDVTCTAEGVAAGTVAYMSPEQAAGQVHQVDTRSDVYSLGKILFQLLTGEPAHELRGLTEKEQLRRVADEEVRRPRQVSRKLDSELECLLLKAMDREPDRRYASAWELARDLDNYLRGSPLAARPYSMRYALRKWMTKHRLAVLAGAAAVALLVGAAGDYHLRLVRERQRAERVSAYLEQLLKFADPRHSGSEEGVKYILTWLERDVSAEFASDPAVEAKVRGTVGEVFLSLGAFREAEAQCARAVELRQALLGADDPATLAAMEHQARACRELGDFAAAERLCRQVLQARQSKAGPAHADTLRAMNTLAYTLNDLGRGGEALATIDEALRLHATPLDVAKPDALAADLTSTKALVLRDVPDAGALHQAESLCRAVLEARRALSLQRSHGMDPRLDPDTLEAMQDLAVVWSLLWERSGSSLADRKRLDDARALLSETVEFGSDVLGKNHSDVLIWRSGHARTLRLQGEYGKARAIYEQVLPESERRRGPLHPYNIILRRQLARVCREAGDWAAAELNYRELVRLQEQKRGPLDPDALRWSEALASVLSARYKWGDSADIYRRVWQARSSAPTLGPNDAKTLESAHNLAVVLGHGGKSAEALDVLQQALSAAGTPASPQARDGVERLKRLFDEIARKAQDADGADDRKGDRSGGI